jgi:Fic family protein
MWRLNWIHPFAGGNGRTSRAVSYLVLCARPGYRIPGTNTIPEQIVANRQPYYEALDEADAAWAKNTTDVRAMERLLAHALAVQLSSILEAAGGSE